MCGALRPADSGKKAVLMGWVNRRRDLGNLIFIDIRDRSGVTQVVFNKERDPAIHQKAEALRNEYVIAVVGTAKQRVPDTVNKNIATGEVELIAEELRILNESKQPPFLPSETVLPNEEMRLKYRYIDLRRDAMQYNIELRHKVALAIRDYLSAQGFFEIETPFMTRSTPEGARDYLVPSRVQPGSFYALPQSPQMFKQILMISGFDKYFQIVRCFRDEDLRADRQPEFTQIDLEMSYPQPERVWEVVEGFLTAAFKAAGHEIKTPVPAHELRRGHAPLRQRQAGHAAARNGGRPFCVHARRAGEIRGGLQGQPGFYFSAHPDSEGGRNLRDRTPNHRYLWGLRACAGNVIRQFDERSQPLCPGLSAIRSNRFSKPLGSRREICGCWRCRKAESKQSANQFFQTCGQLRLDLAQKYAVKHGAFAKTGDPAKDFRFLWVTDFPMFEWDRESERWNAGPSSLHFAAR